MRAAEPGGCAGRLVSLELGLQEEKVEAESQRQFQTPDSEELVPAKHFELLSALAWPQQPAAGTTNNSNSNDINQPTI